VDAQPQLKPARKRSWRQTLLYVVLVLFVAALAVDGVFGAHGLIATYRMKLQVNRQQQKVQQLEQENREFSEQVRELKSDPSAVERVAHQRMGLVKPGELVFELPPDKPDPSAKKQTVPAPKQH
jgi:cell division protein FtsB